MANYQKRGNTYNIRVSNGTKGDGSRDVKCLTWEPERGMTEKQIEKELIRQIILFEDLVKKGLYLDGNIRFNELTDNWENQIVSQLRTSTIMGYTGSNLTRVRAAFGNMKVNYIQPHHILNFHSNLEESGVRADIKYKPIMSIKAIMKEKGLTLEKLAEKAEVSVFVVKKCCNLNKNNEFENVTKESAMKLSNALDVNFKEMFDEQEDIGLSKKTIREHHVLLSTILQSAVNTYRLIPYNPCDLVKAPSYTYKEARYLEEEDVLKLIDALESEPIQYKVMVLLFLWTGIRRGELCGLEYKDLDYKHGLIHIRRSSLYCPEKGIFEDVLKTKNSLRSIHATDEVMEMLREYKDWQDERRRELGSKWQECGRLFTAQNGSPIHPDTVTGWFRDFINDNKLPDICIHSLRHTHASLLIALGVEDIVIAKRLGHDVTTLRKIYSHAMQKKEAIAALSLKKKLPSPEKLVGMLGENYNA